ncbi:MAG: hypothetical protein ABSB32_13710 [Thermodesulfobacteriota bacterium]
MAEKFVPENEPESSPLSPEEEGFLDLIEVREEDAEQFPRELIVERDGEYTGEQRENLYNMILRMSVPQKIRLAMLGNREARKKLIHDRNQMVPKAVLRSPKLTDNEILTFAQERSTPEDIILAICKNRIWVKKYPIRLALVSHPKTPLSIAVQFLGYLHDKDLQALSRDKNISSALAQIAWQVFAKRKR